MSDDPVRRAFDVEIALLTGPPGTAERVLTTGRRRRQRRVVSLGLGAVLAVTSVGVAASTVSRGGQAQTVVPAQTPDAVVSPSASRAPSPTPTAIRTSPPRPQKPVQQSVVLSSTQVAGVRIGTAAPEAERRLRRTLGVPVEHVSTCDGNTYHRTLTWGTLTAVFSRESLQGWEVVRGVSRLHYELPYDGELGLPVRELLRRLPDGKGLPGEGPSDGQYIVTSASTGTIWSARGRDDRGRVETASFEGVPYCD